jgi:ubiquinone/menaquinone biosynthesis C-methylase UbiE
MGKEQHSSGAKCLTPSEFWDALAPHHSAIENSYLDVPSVRRIMHDLHEPVLVVGAGQGLIVAGLRKKAFQCDGVDLSSEMIRYAKLRRGIALVHADAKATPLAERSYGTVMYATGVVDFTDDEAAIRLMLNEGRRIVKESGKIFVAFYRVSAASESFLARVGLLSHSVIALRQSFELYLLNPLQMVAWVAKRASVSYFNAAILLFRMSALSTMQEKRMTFKMQTIFRKMGDPSSLINAAPEKQPYRNEAEIRNLFKRLAIPVKQLEAFASCFMVQIQ